MKKIILSTITFILLINIAFAYTTVKATKIANNPSEYQDKNVLVYIKFDSISFEDEYNNQGIFTGFNVKGIDYVYNLSDKELVEKIKKLKQRDKITIKGKVKNEGFSAFIQVEDIIKDWIDTTLLPPCPEEIRVTCPNCGDTFNYKITKNDYKKSILNKRKKDITPTTNKQKLDKKTKVYQKRNERIKKQEEKQKAREENQWIL